MQLTIRETDPSKFTQAVHRFLNDGYTLKSLTAELVGEFKKDDVTLQFCFGPVRERTLSQDQGP